MDTITDKRPIKTLYFPEGGEISVTDTNGITKIEPYYENGEMAGVVWFKVWQGEFLWQRVNGKHVEGVIYDKENQTPFCTCGKEKDKCECPF